MAQHKILSDVATVSTGINFVMALKTDGTLWSWGANNEGQLGDRTNTNRATPKQIMENIVYVTTGFFSTYAIDTTGRLWAWGNNSDNRLGDGSANHRNTPTVILNNVAKVYAEGDRAMAICNNGDLWAWGINRAARVSGMVGNGNTRVLSVTTPVRVLDNVATVTLGANSTAAIKNDATLWVWGRFPSINNLTNASRPTMVMEDVMAVEIARPSRNGLGIMGPRWVQSSDDSIYVIKNNTSLWGWGDRIGNGSEARATAPVMIMESVHSVSTSSFNHTLVVCSNDNLWSWGFNLNASLGYLTPPGENTVFAPRLLIGQVAQALAFESSSWAIMTDGSLIGFGTASPHLWSSTVDTANFFNFNGAGQPQRRPLNEPSAPSPVNILSISDFEREVLKYTNIEREKHGLHPLKWHDALANAARAHSQDMLENNFIGHVGSDGSTVQERIRRQGIQGFNNFGENCALGTTRVHTPESLVQGWMNSPGHRRNILDPQWEYLGVGIARGTNEFTQNSSHYVQPATQKFLASSGASPSTSPSTSPSRAQQNVLDQQNMHTQQEWRAIETRIRNQVNEALRAAGGQTLPAATGRVQELAEQSARFGNQFNHDDMFDSNNLRFYYEFTVNTNGLNPNLSLTREQLAQITHNMGDRNSPTDFSSATRLAVAVNCETFDWDNQVTYTIVVFLSRT
jgi:uncharacterized protein YkwD